MLHFLTSLHTSMAITYGAKRPGLFAPSNLDLPCECNAAMTCYWTQKRVCVGHKKIVIRTLPSESPSSDHVEGYPLLR
jgi:hypothetical protein